MTTTETFRVRDVAHLVELYLEDRRAEICRTEWTGLERVLGRYLAGHRIPGAELIDGRTPTGGHGDRVLGELNPDDLQVADLKSWLLWATEQPGRGFDEAGQRLAITVGTVNVWRAKAIACWAWGAHPDRGLVCELAAARASRVKMIKPGRNVAARLPEPVASVPEHVIRDACVWARHKAAFADRGDRRHSWLSCAIAVELGREMGCRPGELAKLVLAELHEEDGVRLVRPRWWKTMAHGERRREIPLSARAGDLVDELIEAWRAKRGGAGLFDDSPAVRTERLFPWKQAEPAGPFTVAFKKACVGAGHPQYTANQLRHTFISVGVMINPEATRLAAGHASLETTLSYARNTGRDAAALVQQASASPAPPAAAAPPEVPDPPRGPLPGAAATQATAAAGHGTVATKATVPCSPPAHAAPVVPAEAAEAAEAPRLTAAPLLPAPPADPQTERDWLLVAVHATDPAVRAYALDFARRLREGEGPVERRAASDEPRRSGEDRRGYELVAEAPGLRLAR